jgi:hypothetical protein
MILYEKKFRLGDGVSLSRYINALDSMNFPPYTLLIHKIPGTNDFRIEILITRPVNLWGGNKSSTIRVLLNECTVKQLNEEEFFVLQASAETGNLLMALFFVLTLVALFLMILLTTTTKAEHRELFTFIFIIMLVLAPSRLTYFRERKFLDRIGSIASEL